MKVHNKKNDIHKKVCNAEYFFDYNSWTRAENRLIRGLEYVLLLRVSCFLRSNHRGCHQVTALFSAKAPAGCSNKNSSNRKIESAGDDGKREELLFHSFSFPSSRALSILPSPQAPYDTKRLLPKVTVTFNDTQGKENNTYQVWRVARGVWCVARH